MLIYTLEEAIIHAKRIRKYLVSGKKFKSSKDLNGDCVLASLMLTVALDDIRTLRFNWDHAWNQIGCTVIDITATQFNGDLERDIRGVYVGKPISLCHHKNGLIRGRSAFKKLSGWGVYYTDYPKWNYLISYWNNDGSKTHKTRSR